MPGITRLGAGIAIPTALLDQLITAGYLPHDYPVLRMPVRLWLASSSSSSSSPRREEEDAEQPPPEEVVPRVLWAQDLSSSAPLAHDWCNLWSALKQQLPTTVKFHMGCKIDTIQLVSPATEPGGGGGVALTIHRKENMTTTTTTTERFDVVFGADGYRSLVRQTIAPTIMPEYAGYVAWRGNYPLRFLQEAAPDSCPWLLHDDEGRTDKHTWLTPVYAQGHGIVYLLPPRIHLEHESSSNNSTPDDDGRRVNWVFYGRAPMGRDFTHAQTIPAGAVTDTMYTEFRHLIQDAMLGGGGGSSSDTKKEAMTTTTTISDIFTITPQCDISIQPVYDVVCPSYVDHPTTKSSSQPQAHTPRLVLVGDAGTTARPHTASGSSKAMQDALSLQHLGVQLQKQKQQQQMEKKLRTNPTTKKDDPDTADEEDDAPVTNTTDIEWSTLLTAYDQDRSAAGKQLVEMGRKIGYGQVEHCPDWSTIHTPQQMEAYIKSTLGGNHYFLMKRDSIAAQRSTTTTTTTSM